MIRRLLLSFSIFFSLSAVALSGLYTAANIAELQAIAVTADTNLTVLVRGYYAPGDRGGGTFDWNSTCSATPDGGRYILPSSWTNSTGRWVRVLNGETANVKMWGARGNWHRWSDYFGASAHDDTANIQNALNACGKGLDDDKDTPWTEELLFPSGWYKLTDTLIWNPQIAHLRGEHLEQTELIMASGTAKDILRGWRADQLMKGIVPADMSDLSVRIDDLSFRFNGWETNQFAGQSNSCLVLSYPQEGNCLRGIQTFGGAFGIRCFNGGNGAVFAVRDVVTTDATIAGISVEPAPGWTYCNGQVSITGVTGDYYVSDPPTTASLVRFFNFAGQAVVDDLNAEGCYGAGVILHKVPDASPDFNYTTSEAVLTIRNCQFNGTYGSAYNDFLVLTGGLRTASVSIQSPVQLYTPGSLIRDDVTGRRIPADISVLYNSYVSARLPLSYEGFADPTPGSLLGTRSRLVIGGSAVYSFIPTNTGWYRILAPAGGTPGLISGKLSIRSYYREGAEVEVNVNPLGGSIAPWINVLRSSKNNSVIPPMVTRVRAFHYFDKTYGYWGGVDVYVSNVITNAYRDQEKRLIFSLPLDGVEALDSGTQQLLTPVTPVATGAGDTAGLPNGAVFAAKDLVR